MEPVIKVQCYLHQKGVCPEGPESGKSVQGKSSLGGGAEAEAGVAFLIGLLTQSPAQAGTWQVSG